MIDVYHNLERNTDDTYIYRAYAEPDTFRYKFTMPVSYRGNGVWECHAWNDVKKLWPKVPLIMFSETIKWVEDELRKRERGILSFKFRRKFRCISGTFELDRLNAYKRLFRSAWELKLKKLEWKTYNGVSAWFAIVWFKEKEI